MTAIDQNGGLNLNDYVGDENLFRNWPQLNTLVTEFAIFVQRKEKQLETLAAKIDQIVEEFNEEFENFPEYVDNSGVVQQNQAADMISSARRAINKAAEHLKRKYESAQNSVPGHRRRLKGVYDNYKNKVEVKKRRLHPNDVQLIELWQEFADKNLLLTETAGVLDESRQLDFQVLVNKLKDQYQNNINAFRMNEGQSYKNLTNYTQFANALKNFRKCEGDQACTQAWNALQEYFQGYEVGQSVRNQVLSEKSSERPQEQQAEEKIPPDVPPSGEDMEEQELGEVSGDDKVPFSNKYALQQDPVIDPKAFEGGHMWPPVAAVSDDEQGGGLYNMYNSDGEDGS